MRRHHKIPVDAGIANRFLQPRVIAKILVICPAVYQRAITVSSGTKRAGRRGRGGIRRHGIQIGANGSGHCRGIIGKVCAAGTVGAIH